MPHLDRKCTTQCTHPGWCTHLAQSARRTTAPQRPGAQDMCKTVFSKTSKERQEYSQKRMEEMLKAFEFMMEMEPEEKEGRGVDSDTVYFESRRKVGDSAWLPFDHFRCVARGGGRRISSVMQAPMRACDCGDSGRRRGGPPYQLGPSGRLVWRLLRPNQLLLSLPCFAVATQPDGHGATLSLFASPSL